MRRAIVLTALLCSMVTLVEGGQRDVRAVRPVRELGTSGPLPVQRSGKWGYVNRDGAVVIPPQFEEAGFFYDGRAAVRQNGSWGYIDPSGVAVIPFQFTRADRFSDGLANVRWKDPESGHEPSGYIDRSGRRVITCDGEDANIRLTAQRCQQLFSGGFVMEDVEVFRCADEPGNPKQYPCKGQWIDRIGFYDKTGRLAIPGPFWSAGAVSRFVDGLAGVQVFGTEQKGFIDSSGQWVINPQFDQVAEFSDGLAAVRTGPAGWGFIDKRGAFVIPPQFVSVNTSGFSGGLAAVSVDGKLRGYIDRTGKFVIPPRFEDAGPFSEGLAPVCCDDDRIRYIDAKGNWAFELRLEGSVWNAPFLDGIALVELEQFLLAYIDRSGRVIARMGESK
jgi:hypothetical protein